MFPSPEPPPQYPNRGPDTQAGGWRLPSKTFMYLLSVSQILVAVPRNRTEEDYLMRKLFNHVSTQSSELPLCRAWSLFQDRQTYCVIVSRVSLLAMTPELNQ